MAASSLTSIAQDPIAMFASNSSGLMSTNANINGNIHEECAQAIYSRLIAQSDNNVAQQLEIKSLHSQLSSTASPPTAEAAVELNKRIGDLLHSTSAFANMELGRLLQQQLQFSESCAHAHASKVTVATSDNIRTYLSSHMYVIQYKYI
jgi:hypothetical protein